VAPSAAGAFVSLTPARLLDTRSNLGGVGPVAANGVIHLSVLGQGGVPASGVSAVVLNVLAMNPTAPGYVTVWPDGTTRPTATNLHFVPGQIVPNLVVAKLGANGALSIQNQSAGTIQIVADVAGYYLSGTPSAAGAFASLSPARLLDTRSNLGGVGPVAANGVIHLSVLGRGGVPASGVSAVVLNVLAMNPTAPGYVTVWPDGTTRPTATNLHFVPGQIVPNLVVAKLGANGALSIQNQSAGTIQIVADVAGYYLSGTPSAAGAFASLSPARLLDTRSNLGGVGPVAANGVIHLSVLGRGGVPASGVSAVVLNVLAMNPSAPGYVTVWPDGTTRPTATNLHFVPGQIVPNLVVAKVGANGALSIQNQSAGSMQLVADVAGYYLSGPTTPSPVTSPQAASASATSMALSWTNPTTGPFTGVVIRRATGTTPPPDAGSGTAVTTTSGPTTTYTDTGLTAGTTYSYALFATDGTNDAPGATLTVAAQSLSWGAPSTIDPNTGGLSSVSCPTTTFCAAVDSSGNALTFNGATWTKPTRLDTTGYAGNLTAVSCAPSSFCAAVDNSGNVETYNGTSWSTPVNVDINGLTSVSCPSASFCVAVDGVGKALTYNGSWSAPTNIDSGNGLTSVSCPSASFCVAVDGVGKALTYNGSWSAPPTSIDSGNGLTSVSCTSASFCAAVDNAGNAATFTVSGWGASTSIDGGYLGSVSCATSSSCTAVDYNGNVVTFDGATWATPASIDTANTVASVSCPTVSFCVAVEPRGKALTYNGSTWSGPATIDSDNGPLSAVSCSAATFCAAVDHSGNALTFNGSAWSSPARISVDLYSVSCPSSSFCAAVDADGDALTFNGTWTTAHIDGDHLTAVSCASPLFCAAVDASGKWSMFDGTTWSVPSSIDGFQTLTSVSCPSATFCAAVDSAGNAVTFNGSVWGTPAAVDGTNGSLSSVSCASASFCVAGDGAGRVVTLNGSAWGAPASIATGPVSSVSCPTSSSCNAIDTTGHVTTFNGSTWSVPAATITPTSSPAISCPSALFCAVVESTRSAAILGTTP
jgi:hypothetical protein